MSKLRLWKADWICCPILLCGAAWGQTPALQQPAPPAGQTPAAAQPPTIASQIDQLRPNYILQPGDQILIRAFEMEEISDRPFRLDGEGFLNLPVVGRIKAGGVSVEA